MFRWLVQKVLLICLLAALILSVFAEITTKRELVQEPQPETKGKEDAVLSKFRHTPGYKYLMRLNKELMDQLQICDEMEDYSCRQWAIRAYVPEHLENSTVVFRISKMQKATPFLSDTMVFKCVVSHLEYLLPAVAEETDSSHVKIILNGQKLTQETLSVSGVAIFNLTSVRPRKKNQVRITVTPPSPMAHQLGHSLLYKFCNMNTTVISRLRAAAMATFDQEKDDGMQGDDPKAFHKPNEDTTKASGKKSKNLKSIKYASICENKRKGYSSRKSHMNTTLPPPLVDFQPKLKVCERHKLLVTLDFFPPFVVIQPKYYDVGMCKGLCLQVNDFCRLSPTRTGRALLLNRNANQSLVDYVTCSPHKLLSVSILYYTENKFMSNIIPNAGIRNCRCV